MPHARIEPRTIRFVASLLASSSQREDTTGGDPGEGIIARTNSFLAGGRIDPF